MLDAGHLVESGPTDDVFLAPAHEATRRLLRESGLEPEPHWTRPRDAGVRVIVLRTRGPITHAPWLSTIARDTGVDIGVLAAQVDELQGEAFGRFTLALRGAGVDAAQARLAELATRLQVMPAEAA